MTRRRFAATSAVALVALGLLASPAAQARDGSPCGNAHRNQHYGMVMNCPLWTGSVPVYAAPFNSSSSRGRVVGHLWNGGSANWFFYQSRFFGALYALRHAGTTYGNYWWAYTVSDEGSKGWVSEVYFKGGTNYEADGGLYTRPAPSTPRSPTP